VSSAAGYRDGTAVWAAVTARAKAIAKATRVEPGAVLRQFVFGRFLARVFHDPSAPWVLKGGTAVLARVHDARTTKDVDLLNELLDLDHAIAALRSAAAIDLGDHFRFVITKVEKNLGGADQPEVDGCRIQVDAYCGAAKKDYFGVDLVTGSLMTSEPELLKPRSLDLRGIEEPTMRLYPVADHIADKLCATQATYGADRDRPSSRVRDLVDIVVFALSQDLDGSALTAAIRGEWTHRGLIGTPTFAPPTSWERLYPGVARKVPAAAGFTSFAAAVALAEAFLAPTLDGSAHGRQWCADERAWNVVVD